MPDDGVGQSLGSQGPDVPALAAPRAESSFPAPPAPSLGLTPITARSGGPAVQVCRVMATPLWRKQRAPRRSGCRWDWAGPAPHPVLRTPLPGSSQRARRDRGFCGRAPGPSLTGNGPPHSEPRAAGDEDRAHLCKIITAPAPLWGSPPWAAPSLPQRGGERCRLTDVAQRLCRAGPGDGSPLNIRAGN